MTAPTETTSIVQQRPQPMSLGKIADLFRKSAIDPDLNRSERVLASRMAEAMFSVDHALRQLAGQVATALRSKADLQHVQQLEQAVGEMVQAVSPLFQDAQPPAEQGQEGTASEGPEVYLEPEAGQVPEQSAPAPEAATGNGAAPAVPIPPVPPLPRPSRRPSRGPAPGGAS